MNRDRRAFLAFLAGCVCALSLAGPCLTPASAKDGGSDGSGGGGSGGGSGGSGNSGGGSSGSGSGSSGSNSSGSSGHGGGDDDGGGDDHGGNSGRGSDNSGRRGGDGRDDDAGRRSGRTDDDHDRARNAVRDGRILSLRSVLEKIDAKRFGRVIDVDLRRSRNSDVYQLKVRDDRGVIRTLRVDARNGALLGGQ